MKTTNTFVTILMSSVLLAGCQQATMEANQSFIDDAADWQKAFNEGDQELGGAQYTEDGMLMPPGAPTLAGRQAIAEIFVGADASGAAVSLNTVEGFSAGDLGYAWGNYTMSAADGSIVDEGKYVEVYKRVNGEWLIHRDIYNSNLAAPAADSDNSAMQQALDGYVNVWNTGDLDSLGDWFNADVRRITPGGVSNANGLDELKTVMLGFQTAYPDASVDIDETYFDGSTITLRWTFSGTNTGPGDAPPTGNEVKISGLSRIIFEDGKISEELVEYDNLDFMQQLGYTLSAPK